MRIVTSLLVLLGLAAASVGNAAAPKALAPAAPAPESVLRWKLAIAPDNSSVRNPAGRLSIKPNRGGRRQVYWYLVYTITNTHDEAVPLSTHLRMTTDASAEVSHEGYYPRALKKLRERWGDDLMDSLSLKGHELEPGETVKAVAIFQLYQPGEKHPRPFEERADKLTIHVGGYADIVKRTGLGFKEEILEYKMHFTKKGDQYDPHMESVNFVSAEEVVVTDPDS